MRLLILGFLTLSFQLGFAQLSAERISVIGEVFTGKAWVERYITSDETFGVSISRVGFEPGSRTNWHTHIPGQVLIIESGTAYYQERGKEKVILKAGDIMRCAPGTTHWHGASEDQEMVHLAMTPTREVVWLEAVSDEVYSHE